MPLPYQVTDQEKDGDHCHECQTALERAIIAHDPVDGNTEGWECPTCKAIFFTMFRVNLGFISG